MDRPCLNSILISAKKKMLLELISNEQIHMLLKDCSRYTSDKYKQLEELKIKVKDM